MAGTFEAISGFSQFINPLNGALASMGSKFVGMGKTFLAFAVMVLLTNELYAYFIGGGLQQLISRLMRSVIILSLPLAALMTWGDMSNVLVKFGSEMSTIVGADSSPETALQDLGKSLDTGLKNITQTFWNVKDQPIDWAHPFDSLIMLVGQAIVAIFVGLLLLLYLVAAIAFMLGGLLGLYMPLVMLQLGVIFGPLLIPWILLSSLASLATSWLRYMLVSAFSYAVASVLIAAVLKAGMNITKPFATTPPVGLDGMLAVGGAIIISAITFLFGAYLMIRSDNIAAAMLGGPNPSAGAEYIGAKMAGALSGALKPNNKKGGEGGSGGGSGGGGSGSGGQLANQVVPNANASSPGSSSGSGGAAAANAAATPSSGGSGVGSALAAGALGASVGSGGGSAGGASGSVAAPAGGSSAAAAAPAGGVSATTAAPSSSGSSNGVSAPAGSGGASATAAAPAGGGSGGSGSNSQNNAANAARRIQASGGASSAGAGGSSSSSGGGSGGGTKAKAKAAFSAAWRGAKWTLRTGEKAIQFADKALKTPGGRAAALMAVAPAAVAGPGAMAVAAATAAYAMKGKSTDWNQGGGKSGNGGGGATLIGQRLGQRLGQTLSNYSGKGGSGVQAAQPKPQSGNSGNSGVGGAQAAPPTPQAPSGSGNQKGKKP
jgi:hypothetical protein